MEITFETTNNKVVVHVSGRMDALTAPTFEQGYETWRQGGESAIIVDLSGLEYISSAGLRSILSTAKKVKASGGSLSFCGVQGMAAEVFKVSGFEKLFVLHASQEEAVGS